MSFFNRIYKECVDFFLTLKSELYSMQYPGLHMTLVYAFGVILMMIIFAIFFLFLDIIFAFISNKFFSFFI